MKLLHTSDWHVGKAIRGRSRAEEHRAVLDEIAQIALEEAVDVVLVAGDLFDTAAPTAESEEIVYRSLLALGAGGAQVVVVAGNHDNPRRLNAVAPLLDLGRVHLVDQPRRPDAGGVVAFDTADGTPVRVACLPFVSKRGIIRADDLVGRGADERAGVYADRIRSILGHLTAGFDTADAVHLVCAHLFVLGGAAGGGERPGHLVEEYAVSATAFDPVVHYGALGHLHRPQSLAAPCPLRYCGSPLALDFGEEGHAKTTTLVEASPGVPARITERPLTRGRRLRTLTGTLDELSAERGATGDDWLRIRVMGATAAGMADEVRDWFPEAVEIQVLAERPAPTGPVERRIGRDPVELFDEYLTHVGVDDPAVNELFAELLSDPSGTDAGDAVDTVEVT